MAQKYSNNAGTTLASGITNVATSISVVSSSTFPTITASDYFLATLYDLSGSVEVNHEIVKVTAVSGTTLTVVRGQEGTTARSFVSGARLEVRFTAGSISHYADIDSTNTFTTSQVISVNATTDALRITQIGTGNALVVEDSANPDSTPFIVNADGQVGIGKVPTNAVDIYNASAANLQVSSDGNTIIAASRYSTDATGAVNNLRKYRGTVASPLAVATGDSLGYYRFGAYGGINTRSVAQMEAVIEQYTSDINISSYLRWSTATASTSPTEKLRLDSAGKLTIGSNGAAGINASIYNSRSIKGATSAAGYYTDALVSSEVTTTAVGIQTALGTTGTFTLATLVHFYASQRPFDVNSAVTNQYGFSVDSSLSGATNNYGFYGNIAAGTGRYNFYANGTAANYFAGDVQLGKTVTTAGTTGNQTINKTIGSVNFASGATSLVVTNNLVTTNSIITATVGSNDSTMKSVAVVAAAGSFTIYANAAPTAETRVNFHIFN